MSDLSFTSGRALADLIRRRAVSSLELVDHFLTRIERYNPALNAVVTLDPERARAAARAADAKLARGDQLGPLHGVPMTLKDAFEVAGMRTTAGAELWKDHIPTDNAVAVQRLIDAGVIVLGKTNVPAFCADIQSYNSIFGTTNNPWNVARTPGGSSGGAAAAVAAGLSPIELGSDIGGSIRTPAHFCGVFGHKPTYGIVPTIGHLPGPPGRVGEIDLNVCGPLARSADDLRLMMNVLAGPSREQQKAWSLSLPAPRAASLRGYRVAVWFDEPSLPLDDSMRSCLEGAVDSLRRAGVQVEQAQPAFELVGLRETYSYLLNPIMSSGWPQALVDSLAQLATDSSNHEPIAVFARTALVRHRDWLGHHERREQLRKIFATFFERFDVLLCPVLMVPAFAHDQSPMMLTRTLQVNGQAHSYMDVFGWIAAATSAHLPATVAPVGRTADGLPVGIQIIGPHLEDHTTIDFAGRISELTGGFVPPPGY